MSGNQCEVWFVRGRLGRFSGGNSGRRESFLGGDTEILVAYLCLCDEQKRATAVRAKYNLLYEKYDLSNMIISNMTHLSIQHLQPLHTMIDQLCEERTFSF